MFDSRITKEVTLPQLIKSFSNKELSVYDIMTNSVKG